MTMLIEVEEHGTIQPLSRDHAYQEEVLFVIIAEELYVYSRTDDMCLRCFSVFR